MNRKLRMGMVGGGTDAFIGAIHRLSAFMDNQIELVCGCFSVDPEISKSSGKSYFLRQSLENFLSGLRSENRLVAE